MAKNRVVVGPAVRLADLEEQQEKAAATVAELSKQRAALVAEKAKLEGEARQSLAGVALDKLRGVARSQAEAKVKAEEVAIALAEVGRRLGEAQQEAARLDTEIKAVRFETAASALAEEEVQIARLLRQAADMIGANLDRARAARYTPEGERAPKVVPLLFGAPALNTMRGILAQYGETYETRTGQPAPIRYEVQTTGGWRPARKSA